MSQAARASAERFSIDATAQHLRALYDKLNGG
jgi:hypothetical protein